MSELTGGASQLGWVVVKALLMFAVAVIGLRFGERRTLAQLAPFDVAVAVAIGAIIGRTSTSSSTSFATGAVGLVTLLAAHRLVAMLRRRGLLRRALDSPPRVLVRDGVLDQAAMARADLTTGDVYALLRERGVVDLAEVQYLIYEVAGRVSVVRRDQQAGDVVAHALSEAATTGWDS